MSIPAFGLGTFRLQGQVVVDSVGAKHQRFVNIRNLEWPRRHMTFKGLELETDFPTLGI